MKLAFLDFFLCGPADAVYNPLRNEFTSESEQLHLRIYKSGSQISSAYWRTDDGRLSNPCGPAGACFWPSGELRSLQYHVSGMAHREDGPAIIEWDQSGNIVRQQHIISPWLRRA